MKGTLEMLDIVENVFRLLWQSRAEHIYFRLQAKTREDEYAALGTERFNHLEISK